MSDCFGFLAVDESTAEDAAEAREREGWQVFRLSGEMNSKDDFFDSVRETLPLDPPLHQNESWDALDDSLWSGLLAHTNANVLIIWSGARRMRTIAPEDFTIATDILSRLPHSLADPSVTAGPTTQLLVLQVL